jgi:hypothetical protein
MFLGRCAHLGVLFVALGASCKQPTDAPAPSAAPSASAPPPARVRTPLSSANAFELVTLGDGAGLFWGEPQGGVMFQRLDALGEREGAAQVVAKPDTGFAIEIAAAQSEARVGVAWSRKNAAGEKSTVGVLGDAATRSFGEPFDLGPLELAVGDERGQLAVSANDGPVFVALRRGTSERCPRDQALGCLGFGFREIGAKGRADRGLPMAVPKPCARALVGYVVIGERAHYAFCSEEDGTSVITHFMRQLSPFYVDVFRVLRGCKPVGMTRVGDEALVVADCPKGREGVFVGGMGQKPRHVEVGRAELSCPLGRPKLRAPGDHPLDFDFATPGDSLAPLLPRELAPPGSRAVWTGSAIVVASSVAGALEITRHECQRGLMTRRE